MKAGTDGTDRESGRALEGELAVEPSGRPSPGRSLVAAFQFLTVAPLTLRPPATAGEVAHSMAYFPLVGGTLGLVLAAADATFGLAFVGPARVGLLVAALVLLTRAIHLDGLMDSFDGLFGGWTPERRLEIMRDSRVGSFGALAAAGDLLLRFAALLAIPPWLRLPALLSALALGRWSLVYATFAFPYARSAGLGAAYKARVGRLELALATAFVLVIVVAAFLTSGASYPASLASAIVKPLGLLALAWVVAAGFGRYVISRLPGQTGDTYGATNELVEISVLLVFGSPLFGLVG